MPAFQSFNQKKSLAGFWEKTKETTGIDHRIPPEEKVYYFIKKVKKW
ncbi:hypothetical protein cpu_00360 [Carboxydothermus pertinax]|uniref:Uncharacterized protein n=1 Tax=Carboxydothermus pertinax TaxID=870242 RepID=A0A1L8CRH8_9THEO|nr:hypothetical protein cpu_00360 [Carboxydothermus pertinax]